MDIIREYILSEVLKSDNRLAPYNQTDVDNMMNLFGPIYEKFLNYIKTKYLLADKAYVQKEYNLVCDARSETENGVQIYDIEAEIYETLFGIDQLNN